MDLDTFYFSLAIVTIQLLYSKNVNFNVKDSFQPSVTFLDLSMSGAISSAKTPAWAAAAQVCWDLRQHGGIRDDVKIKKLNYILSTCP